MSRIVLNNDNHGHFEADAQRVSDLMDCATGSVNYDVVTIQAYCSEVTGFDYFDLGILELCVVMAAGLGVNTVDLTELMASAYTTPEWVESVREFVTYDNA